MKYPTQRYGSIHELAYLAMGIPIRDLAKRLRRSERSVRNWLSGAEKMPWWVPEILRLQRFEYEQRMYQMNIQPLRVKLGLVGKTATVHELHRPRQLAPPTVAPLDARQA